jgi:3' terminal RNA ribose 2'-O-methyltransferase Hen1
MLLTISTTHRPATDLGFLLHKHPDRVHEVTLGFGVARVFFPRATADRCTAALIVDVDPVGLVRDRKGGPRGNDASLEQYVNDRPYAASSFTSVALNRCFGTAIGGRSKERPELADTPIDLEAELPVVPCRGGEQILRRLFEPLGYDVTATPLPLDAHFPEWGDSRYFALGLRTRIRLSEMLQHLFVLLPVLDDDKHYWVGTDEVDKLLRRGGEWLAKHPDHELIARRYLRHDRALTEDALDRLREDSVIDPSESAARADAEEAAVEETISLYEQRVSAVLRALAARGAHRALDLGCGEGRLVERLLSATNLERVVGVDVSHRALERAARRLRLDTMTPRQRERVELIQGSLTYRDRRLAGYDAAIVIEVVEHIDPARLGAFERSLFHDARPATVILTTPNKEYNVRFPSLPAGELRHRDHRFEWTRAEFEQWAQGVGMRAGYSLELSGVGPVDSEVGCPTQMAVFTR